MIIHFSAKSIKTNMKISGKKEKRTFAFSNAFPRNKKDIRVDVFFVGGRGLRFKKREDFYYACESGGELHLGLNPTTGKRSRWLLFI